MRSTGPQRSRLYIPGLLIVCTIFTGLGLLQLNLWSDSLPTDVNFLLENRENSSDSQKVNLNFTSEVQSKKNQKLQPPLCATVEEMGDIYGEVSWKESLRVRRLIQDHFALHGASRVRKLPPEQFCRQGFVMGKASEAGFGNEMYKILTAAGLSIMLKRSLIIGQTRGKYPFENFVSYTNLSFTLKEVKHLWRQNNCVGKYGRHLVIRIDDFEKPAHTNVLCSNWRKWKQPIIWLQSTVDAVAAQFFLKNVYPDMRNAAASLFGKPEYPQSRPNIIGELMRVIISPSEDITEAVNWVLDGGFNPHIALHMRMLMNRSPAAVNAALRCIKKAMLFHNVSRPRVVLLSDTPSLINDITPKLWEFAEVSLGRKLNRLVVQVGQVEGSDQLRPHYWRLSPVFRVESL